jgi:hypothetical protein
MHRRALPSGDVARQNHNHEVNPGAEPVQRAASSVGSVSFAQRAAGCHHGGVLFLIAQVVIWTIDQRLNLDAARDPVFTRRRSSISKKPGAHGLFRIVRQEVSTPNPAATGHELSQ